METYKQDKASWKQFLTAIQNQYELIAPVKKSLPKYATITHPDEIYLEKNTYFPLKKYFFTQRDVLFRFHKHNITVPKQKTPPRVFFGVRMCDLNAVKHQDLVFIHDSQDPYYSERRKNSYLLGYHCNEAPSKWCFCESLDLVDFFDLMFYDKGDHFLVEVGSEKGKYLLNQFKRFFTKSNRLITQAEKKIPGADRLETKDIGPLYDHPDWQKGVDLCLSCSACTALCPTCYCFDIHDEVTTADPEKGERIRQWSSCQVQEFTRVAGNHVFREKREERFKHRIYHQLDYFKEKYGVNLCVGCGRCIEGCPTRIDFVDIINKMNKDGKKSKP